MNSTNSKRPQSVHPRLGSIRFLRLLLLLMLLLFAVVDAFVPPTHYNYCPPKQPALFLSSRYGPPLDDRGDLRDLLDGEEEEEEEDVSQRQQQLFKTEFKSLLDQVLEASAVEHIPSLLTKHTQLLLRMPPVVVSETIQELLDDTTTTTTGDDDDDGEEVERVTEAVDMILSFVEDFVTHSKTMDDNHKQLLGHILRTMTNNNKDDDDRDREEQLDEVMARSKDHFTRGFLRYLDGECDRISSAPSLNKDSARLQETLLVIKTRILEELGQDLGEGALVLGQLVAYDDRNERLAVLEAGLQVRGIEFAQELRGLTEEALVGFQAVPNGDVDPTLVSRVEEIDERVRSFVKDNGAFQ